MENEQKIASNDEPAAKYGIYHYFKEHTAFLVACVSALVAVVSFILKFAINRCNAAYLAYWNVSKLYVGNDVGQIYLVLGAFLYCFALILISQLFGSTAEVFRNYSEYLSYLDWRLRQVRKADRALRRAEKQLKRRCSGKKAAALTAKKKAVIQAGIADSTQELQELKKLGDLLKQVFRPRKQWMIRNILAAVVIAFLVVLLLLLLMIDSITLRSLASACGFSVLFVLFDSLLYFLPAYLQSRCTKEKYDKINHQQIADALVGKEQGKFPLEKLLLGKTKRIVSNGQFLMLAIQLLTAIVITVFTLAISGRATAQNQKEFSIYTDESGTYAIVYRADDTVILESAEVNGTVLSIDTSRQRVLTTDDLSYVVSVFETVERME